MKNQERAILLILKNPYEEYNSRSLSKLAGISHAGMFKLLKKLEKENILVSRSVGKAKIYSINFENSMALKKTEIDLMAEAHQSVRWIEEFKALETEAEFVVLFGSIIRKPSEASDIDLLVVAEGKKFARIKKHLAEKDKIMAKKIHLLLQTKEDFLKDFKKRNKAIIEIIKTGIVLFGQDEFIKTIGEK